jgi:hypothetical protein
MPLTINEFASQIKEKYPAYSGMDDLDLTTRILQKYPQYNSALVQTPASPQGPQAPMTSAPADVTANVPKGTPDESPAVSRIPQTYAQQFQQSLQNVQEGATLPEHPSLISIGKAIGQVPLRLAGGAMGNLYNLGMVPLQAMAQDAASTIGAIGPGSIGIPSTTTLGSLYNVAANKIPGATAVASTAENVLGNPDVQSALNLLPFVGKVPGMLSATGKAATNLGKTVYTGQLGITKSLAGKIAPEYTQAEANIGNTIKDYKLDSPLGYKASFQNAKDAFKDKWTQADDLIKQYAEKNPGETTTLKSIVEDVKAGIPGEIRAGERTAAKKVIDNIHSDIIDELKAKNIDPDKLSPTDLVDVKRSIGAKYKHYDPSLDPVKEAMYDSFQSGVIKKINGYVPEAGKLNLEARDIKFAQDALENALSKKPSPFNALIRGTEVLGGMGTALAHPASIPAIAGTIAVRELGQAALNQGRAASTLMNLGRGVSKVGDVLTPAEKPMLPPVGQSPVNWNPQGPQPNPNMGGGTGPNPNAGAWPKPPYIPVGAWPKPPYTPGGATQVLKSVNPELIYPNEKLGGNIVREFIDKTGIKAEYTGGAPGIKGKTEPYHSITITEKGKSNGEGLTIEARNLQELKSKYEAKLKEINRPLWKRIFGGKPSGAIGGSEAQMAQQKTPQFKNFFGDWEKSPETASKVVHENGQPKIVTNGRTMPDVPKSGEFPQAERGRILGHSFWTDSPEVSDGYAVYGAPLRDLQYHKPSFQSNVTPAYLNIRNPVTEKTSLSDMFKGDINNLTNALTDKEGLAQRAKDYQKSIDYFYKKQHPTYDQERLDKIPTSQKEEDLRFRGLAIKTLKQQEKDIRDIVYDMKTKSKDDWGTINKVLQSHGFAGGPDFVGSFLPEHLRPLMGLMEKSPGLERYIKKNYDGFGFEDHEVHNTMGVKSHTYIPFSENQIKSAIANNGSFNPGVKSILRSAPAMASITGGTAVAVGKGVQTLGKMVNNNNKRQNDTRPPLDSFWR